MDGSPESTHVAVAETGRDRERVYRFRYEVYVEEMGMRDLSYADHSKKILRDALDESGRIYFAEAGGEVVATVRVNFGAAFLPADIYRTKPFVERFGEEALSFCSRLMVSEGKRGSAALYLVLREVYEHGIRNGVLFDFCNCTPSLLAMYEHLGYRRYADNFLDPELGFRVPLVLPACDAAHLESIRSPFWRTLREYRELWQPPEVASWFHESFPQSPRCAEWQLSDEEFWRLLTAKLQCAPQSAVGVLEGLSEEEAKEVLQKGTVLACKSGDRIVRTDDASDEMYIVLSGLVDVRAPGNGRSLGILGRGQVFGDVALLAGFKRTADVVALEDSELLVFRPMDLDRLMARSPRTAAKVLLNLSRVLCERLAVRTQELYRTED